MHCAVAFPTVKDRVVQTAAVVILEPIFEADFLDCSYGFRPGRSAHQALEAVGEALKQGKQQVYDADLRGYFDSIPHDKLMACLRKRIADRSVLKLIRMWLKAPILEYGRPWTRPRAPSRLWDPARRSDHASNNRAKHPITLEAVISRVQLRAPYGRGFGGSG